MDALKAHFLIGLALGFLIGIFGKKDHMFFIGLAIGWLWGVLEFVFGLIF